MDKYIVYHFAGARKLYNCPQLMFSADIKQATFYDKKEAIEQVKLLSDYYDIPFFKTIKICK